MNTNQTSGILKIFYRAELCLLFYIFSGVCWANQLDELKALNLEELANIEVTIASKTPQSVDSVPAAVFVITHEDIRRSTASNIPELLRMVPGLNVAQIDASHWAISSRGFNGRFANKLLVLMDGRSVYTPLFSGVYWNVQDTLLEDIERIEVIRGPGATVWGANAVNGVINIITRSVIDTKGGLLSVSAGDPEKANIGFRYGEKLNDGLDYRVYGKFRSNREYDDSSVADAVDKWHDRRFGFRIDGDLSDYDDVTLQGDIYRNRVSQASLFPDLQAGQIGFTQTLEDKGGNVLARWGHGFDNNDYSSLQIYYDYQTRDEGDDKRHTFDMEFNYQFAPRGNHNVVMGLAYRFMHDTTWGQPKYFNFSPNHKAQRIFSVFMQDEIQFHPQWMITLGSKFEHNQSTGFEVQPSIRVLWNSFNDSSIWFSASRAARTPSRSEQSINGVAEVLGNEETGFSIPIQVRGIGNPDLDTEILHAYEIGYRVKLAEQLSLDITAFYNDYRSLVTVDYGELSFAGFPEYLEQSVNFGNQADADTWGVELAADWRINDEMKLQAAYSLLKMDIQYNADVESNTFSDEYDSPEHQLSLRFSYTPSGNWETDLWLRYMDAVYENSTKISDYWDLDARLAWIVNKQLEISLVGQNLLDNSRSEYDDELNMLARSEIPRGVYLKALWKFD